MADLTAARTATEIPPPGQHGVVTRAPAAIGAPMQVNVPDFSGDHFVEITRWVLRGSTLPALEDEVLVVKDERGEAWVIGWWPAAGDSPDASVATTKGSVVEAPEDLRTVGNQFLAPRPGGHPSVEWVCVMEPFYATDYDTWANPGQA